MQDPPKPFLQHLSELRLTLLAVLAAWAAGMGLILPFAPRLFAVLCHPLNGVTSHPEDFLRSLEISGGFSIAIQIVLWGGLLVSAPLITVLLARFVLPALTPLERRAFAGALVAALGLFGLGVLLAYWVTLPVALRVLFGLHVWLGVRAEWTAVSYVGFAVKLMLLFGLAFEMPVALVALGYAGLVRSAALRAKRRHAVVAILILAMVLTPGPDVVSQVIMAGPMLVLYEACIWILRLVERRRTHAA